MRSSPWQLEQPGDCRLWSQAGGGPALPPHFGALPTPMCSWGLGDRPRGGVEKTGPEGSPETHAEQAVGLDENQQMAKRPW